MPPASTSRTRQTRTAKTSSVAPRTRKTVQTVPASSAKSKNVASVPSRGTKKRKRSPEIGNDDQARATTPLDVSKRVKTSPTIINKVPIEKLTVLIFGGGESSELGLGPKRKEVLRPSKNPRLDVSDPSAFHVVQLACGGMHTVALTADNKIITWGVNDDSALGRDTQWDGKSRDIDAASDDEDDDEDMNPLESSPMEIPADYFPPNIRFVQVAAGDSCSFVLTDTGLVYGWGTFRVSYHLHLSSSSPILTLSTSQDSRGHKGFKHDDNGKLVETQTRPILIQGLQNITQICCGDKHALALDAAGNIWAWGCNEQNQFGRRLFGRNSDPLTPCQVRVCRNKAKYIASGCYHSFAVDRDDNVWAWGANSFGQAGDARTAGSNSAFVPPVKIRGLCQKQVLVLDGGVHHSAAVTADGQCLVWGRIDDGQLGIAFTPEQIQDSTLIRCDEHDKPRICLCPTAITAVQKVAYAACGTDHTVFIDQAGNAYATGYGFQGQLGLGSNDDVKEAQRITGKYVKDMPLTWTGAGAQFSIVAGPSESG